MNNSSQKILVAMSGGVDSAMAVYFLQQQGFEVTGVHFILNRDKQHCQEQVRELAKHFNIDLIFQDISDDFNQQVVEYFIQTYRSNLTPNPCVVCNQRIKFHHLIQAADKLRIEKVATGHYAKIITDREQDRPLFQLAKAKDQRKDQSYFLYRLNQSQLSRIVFPLGEYTKQQVKDLAGRMDLPVPEKESQDSCFFADGESARQFLARKIQTQLGLIMDEHGHQLGHHHGLEFYTQGQRFGLNLSGGPYYVIGKDRDKNTLVVSKDRQHPALLVKTITISDSSWIASPPKIGQEYMFRSRYQVEEISGVFMQSSTEGFWTVELDEPQWAVAKGQSLVAYDQERVVGGGIIEKASQ